MPEDRIVIFAKEGNFGMLAHMKLPEGTLITSYDSREGEYKQAYREIDSEKPIDFNEEVEITEGRGWRIIYNDKSPVFHPYRNPN